MAKVYAGALAALVLAGCGQSVEEESAPPVAAPAPAGPAAPVTAPAGLDVGWNDIEPGGETVCSDGSPYRFFVRPGDPERLLVYFQGGGACWFAENCDLHLDPSYKPTVAEDDPARYGGIFDFTNPENPFAEYSVVMVPYCTADVHLGDAVATYQAPAREAEAQDDPEAPAQEDHAAHTFTIQHKGFVNAGAVLDWTYEHFPSPERIFVTGSSAGAIPSPYYAWQIADHYSEADIAQLGDGAGGYRRTAEEPPETTARWGTLEYLSRYPEFAAMAPGEFTYESLYIAAAKRHPDILFAEYDAAEDEVQRRYLAMSGNETQSLRDLLDANHADIRAEVDNFRYYIAGGDSHTILARPEFYTYHVGGVRVRDWVAALADFEAVNDVACTDCATAEVVDRSAETE